VGAGASPGKEQRRWARWRRELKYVVREEVVCRMQLGSVQTYDLSQHVPRLLASGMEVS
jgi:hypothetical protein